MSIEQRLAATRQEVDQAAGDVGRAGAVELVAVTKTIDSDRILAAYRAGQRSFGENRVQEASGKIEHLRATSPDACWRLIGHLQSNKAKQALSTFDAVDSLDSVRLANILHRHAQEQDRSVRVLLEVNVAAETSKSGFAPDELRRAMPELLELSGLILAGLMTVAPAAPDAESVRWVFGSLRDLRDEIASAHGLPDFAELSMGMSGDFRVAIEEGATMVRIGRAIFGEREAPERNRHDRT